MCGSSCDSPVPISSHSMPSHLPFSCKRALANSRTGQKTNKLFRLDKANSRYTQSIVYRMRMLLRLRATASFQLHSDVILAAASSRWCATERHVHRAGATNKKLSFSSRGTSAEFLRPYPHLTDREFHSFAANEIVRNVCATRHV